MSDLLVVTDLDGTIVLDPRGPEPAVLAALDAVHATPGVRLAIATSRPPENVRRWFGPLVDEIDVLCCNGALTAGPSGRSRRAIRPRALLAMTGALREAGAEYCVEYGDHLAATSASGMPWMGTDRRRVLRAGSLPPSRGAVKLSVGDAAGWAERFSRRSDVTVYAHATGDLDAVAAGVSKHAALARLRRRGTRVLALGNDANDSGMLRAADRAVVVGPGLPDLDDADHVRRVAADVDAVVAALREEVLCLSAGAACRSPVPSALAAPAA